MKNVLITGTSTGIGLATALRLDARGWRVIAGVRSESDADRLKTYASRSLQTVILDLADAASIEAAAKDVETLTCELHALVNNAGVTVQAPLEYVALDDLRHQFEVNVVGHIACTQALLPALRRARGRIVFMSSVQGRARALPLLGPYCASKWAIEALADTLRIELHDSDVDVSIIEPGTIDTPIWDKMHDDVAEIPQHLPTDGRARYDRLVQRGLDLTRVAKTAGADPERVAAMIERALTAGRPRPRYAVGDARARLTFERLLPERFRDWLIDDVAVGRKKRSPDA